MKKTEKWSSKLKMIKISVVAPRAEGGEGVPSSAPRRGAAASRREGVPSFSEGMRGGTVTILMFLVSADNERGVPWVF